MFLNGYLKMMKNVEYISGDWDTHADYGYRGAGWYFWDETGRWCHGPYDSVSEAYTAMKNYTESI